MEHENERIAEAPEHCGRPPLDSDAPDAEEAEAVVAQPSPLFELTTPGGRVWYVVNLN